MKDLDQSLRGLLDEFYREYPLFDDPIQLEKEVDGYICIDDTSAYDGIPPECNRKRLSQFSEVQCTQILLDQGVLPRLLDIMEKREPEVITSRVFRRYDMRDQVRFIVLEEVETPPAAARIVLSMEFLFKEGGSGADISFFPDSMDMVNRPFMKVLRLWPEFNENFLTNVLDHFGYLYL